MILVLGQKEDAGFFLSRMPMDTCGKDPDMTCKSITFNRTELRDSALSKREGLHM